MDMHVGLISKAISMDGLTSSLKIAADSAPHLTIATALPPIHVGLVLRSSNAPIHIESTRSLRYVDPKTLRNLNAMRLSDVPVGAGIDSKEE